MRHALIAVCLLTANLWSADDGAFKPRLVEPVTLPAAVRPGGSFPLVLRFVNDGTAAADADHRVFIHFEPAKECRDIAIGADHEPALPTTLWKPGAEIVDGPLVINVGENVKPGTYHFHVGVYGKRRYSDIYAGQLRVAGDAPVTSLTAALTEEEVTRRRAAWAARAVDGEVVEGAQVRLRVDRVTGVFTITDKAAQVAWDGDPYQPWLGLAWVNALTAKRLLDGYRRLDATGHVLESRFGDVRAVANLGAVEAKVGETVLPPFGLLVESPTFVAFHATRHSGVDYPGGALFTLTSLDGQPLDQSKRIRVFHGFGPDRVAVAGKVISVPKEQVVGR